MSQVLDNSFQHRVVCMTNAYTLRGCRLRHYYLVTAVVCIGQTNGKMVMVMVDGWWLTTSSPFAFFALMYRYHYINAIVLLRAVKVAWPFRIVENFKRNPSNANIALS